MNRHRPFLHEYSGYGSIVTLILYNQWCLEGNENSLIKAQNNITGLGIETQG